MNARAWQRFFEQQRDTHGKVVFTVTELANVGGCSANALNVALTRLRHRGEIARYAQGLYGLPGAASPEALLPYLDASAYMTGMAALNRHGFVTQRPVVMTCFTSRHSPRGRDRRTAAGRFSFVCVRSRVYAYPSSGCVAAPEQALCDFVYLSRRRGLACTSLCTLRKLDALAEAELQDILPRYPRTIRAEVGALRAAGCHQTGLRGFDSPKG